MDGGALAWLTSGSRGKLRSGTSGRCWWDRASMGSWCGGFSGIWWRLLGCGGKPLECCGKLWGPCWEGSVGQELPGMEPVASCSEPCSNKLM